MLLDVEIFNSNGKITSKKIYSVKAENTFNFKDLVRGFLKLVLIKRNRKIKFY